MELDILLRRYARLRQELAAAYRSLPWQSSRIDPLADDLADVEQHIARLRPLLRVSGQMIPVDIARNGILSDTRLAAKSRY